MNVPRRIRTIVVSVPVDSCAGDANDLGGMTRGLTASARLGAPRFRPSDLLPWSDPYIAGLVRKLQEEVREAVAPQRIASEAEMPWNEPFEYEAEENDGFTIDADKLLLK